MTDKNRRRADRLPVGPAPDKGPTGAAGGGVVPSRSARRATVYPAATAAAVRARMDVIDPREAATLDGLFRARVARSPDKTAYIQHCPQRARWVEYSWDEMAEEVGRWHRAVAADGLARGERAAIRMDNRREWILYDQACLACGLVVTPLYSRDRPDNVAFILEHTGARLFFVENVGMWREMVDELPRLGHLRRVVVLEDPERELAGAHHRISHDSMLNDPRVMPLSRWLERGVDQEPPPPAGRFDDLATIVYTSGTAGKPKGVMLSHANILTNAHASLASVPVFPDDKFLSFLPLSHMFERTVGCYLPMMAGAVVAFNRSIAELPDDLAANRPTLLITVPRIFERAYGAVQTRLARGPAWRRWLFEQAVAVGWRRFEISQGRAAWGVEQLLWPLFQTLVARNIRARFGGNLRCVISGGAPLAAQISRMFIALGVRILQGYGLTETSPVLTANTPSANKPWSIGLPLAGAEIRLSEDGELQARGPGVMLGYWRDHQATGACIDPEGWFASGDVAAIDEDGFISITGRIKEIIVLATGEKAPPASLEAAICDDPLIEQAMVVGEGRPFLSALVVLEPEEWRRCAPGLGVDADDPQAPAQPEVQQFILDKITGRLRDFPGYAAVRRVWLSTEPWSVDNGALTPTLKLKREVLRERYQAQIEKLYEGH